MNKIDISKILKLSLGSSLAIFIAYFFQLQYAMVAGVITLLVVKDTKKETIKGAMGKLLGFILCTLYSYLCFNFLGIIYGHFHCTYYYNKYLLCLKY